MIKIESVQLFGWDAAIRGMRNPKNSWSNSDTNWVRYYGMNNPMCDDFIGENDLNLMKTLSKAGTDHGKFLRMIHVQVDVTAPLYWWKEADQYKVGTVTDSCSTMHKIHAKEFTRDDFSCEHLLGDDTIPDHGYQSSTYVLDMVVQSLNFWRNEYLNGTESGIPKDKRWWWQMIQLLPSSYNQKRTWDLNYAVLKTIYHARKDHKLDEWRQLCKWIETLPYADDLIVKG